MFDYTSTIEDTAYSIFLNFYKATKENLLLTTEDTHHLIDVISLDYNTDALKVEKDVSIKIKNMVQRIPTTYLHEESHRIH